MTQPRYAVHVGQAHLCRITEPTVHLGGPVVAEKGHCAQHTLVWPADEGAADKSVQLAVRVGDRARCNVPQLDTVRGGLISVFIEGMPAARGGDRTDNGFLQQAIPNLELGEWDPDEPLTPYQAEWLYDYLSGLGDEIPYEYGNDGCYARADRMAQHMEALGLKVDKVFVDGYPGKLRYFPPGEGTPIVWDWHVAPSVAVQGMGSAADPVVLDPSVGRGLMLASEWKKVFGADKGQTNIVPASIYRSRYDPKTKGWQNEPRIHSDELGEKGAAQSAARRAQDLAKYRHDLAGRNGGGEPKVHY